MLARLCMLLLLVSASGPATAGIAPNETGAYSRAVLKAIRIVSISEKHACVLDYFCGLRKNRIGHEAISVRQMQAMLRFSEAGTQSKSLADRILSQGAADGEDGEDDSRARDNGPPQARAEKDKIIPGALIALIFGVFGLLVVARRKVR